MTPAERAVQATSKARDLCLSLQRAFVGPQALEYRTGKQRLIVTATSTGSGLNPPAKLSAQPFDAKGVAQKVPVGMGPPVAGIYTPTLVGVPQPATVKVTSNLGGSASSGIMRLRQ